MSDVQRGLFKKKIAEAEARLGGGSVLSEEDEQQDTVAPLSFAGPPPSIGRRRNRVVEPKSWNQGYFEQNFIVSTDEGDFNVYFTPPKDLDSPMFVFQHGAGSSALSFGLVASKIVCNMQDDHTLSNGVAKGQNSGGVGGCMAFDMRGHGLTPLKSDDFALETVTEDFLAVVEQVWEKMGWADKQPPLIIVGHSLGGSIVAHAAIQKNRLKRLVGVVVLDVVEGLTLEALDSMNKVLSTFPSRFESPGQAIEWHLRHHHLSNKDSAALSVPALLQQEGEHYTWIMDLKKTEPYWKDWFEGLSSKFLRAPAARLLILAGTDRLDKELMIGQMQGKYQLMVFNEAGHFLHEDCADKTAITLVDFWTRNGKPANIVPVFGKFRDS